MEPSKNNMKFTDIVLTWWKLYQVDLSENSLNSYYIYIYRHIIPYFKGMTINCVDENILNGFLDHEYSCGNRLTRKPLSNKSVMREFFVLRSSLEYAKQKKYISINPAEFCKLKKPIYEMKYHVYTEDEIYKLCDAARPKWMADIILLAYLTGMRRGEIYGLQWGDIDWENKSFAVTRSAGATSPHETYIHQPKTERSTRIILLCDQCIDILKNRYKSRTSEIWVFANKYGERISPWYNVNYFHKACDKCGITNKRFHDLRHTHISNLIEAGFSPAFVQQRVGHSNLNMTMRYTHLTVDTQYQIVEWQNKKEKKR